MKGDQETRAALDQHWAASDASDFETEHRIYHEDAVLEYPQSGGSNSPTRYSLQGKKPGIDEALAIETSLGDAVGTSLL